MEITIRRVLPEDAHGYTAVHIACWRDAYAGIISDEYLENMSSEAEQRAERLKQTLKESGDSEFYCVEHNGNMIGRLIFNKSRDEDKSDAGEVSAIYLPAAYWGRGFGKQMMDFAVAELKRIGYREVTVWVLEENGRGRQFYEKYGFALDGAKKTVDLDKSLSCLRYALELGD